MPRRSRVIDTEPFSDIMSEALSAYRQDPNYAILMARQATTIANKRRVWQFRLELREAESTAVKACRQAEPFVCETEQPCGTGTCRFAQGDMVLLQVPAVPGKTHRPMPSTHEPTCTIETAVRPLQELREERPRLKAPRDEWRLNLTSGQVRLAPVFMDALQISDSEMHIDDLLSMVPLTERYIMKSELRAAANGREVRWRASYGDSRVSFEATARRAGQVLVGKAWALAAV